MENRLTSRPLVSIVIVTYNSSKYVLELLESCKAQSYDNLELVISDDASTDNTLALCKDWLDKNGSYFSSCQLVEAEENTGVAFNVNRGVLASNGKWFKLCAGDDILHSEAINTYMQQGECLWQIREMFVIYEAIITIMPTGYGIFLN